MACLFGGDFAQASESTACIESMRVLIHTRNNDNSGIDSGIVHYIVLTLYNGDEVRRSLEGPVSRNQQYTNEFDLGWINRPEISAVYLESGDDDGWYIAQAVTQPNIKTRMTTFH